MTTARTRPSFRGPPATDMRRSAATISVPAATLERSGASAMPMIGGPSMITAS